MWNALDLSGNELVVSAGSLATISNQLAEGYANGVWNGNGIQSSAAASDSTHLSALGDIINNAPGTSPLYGTGTALGQFNLNSPGANAILVGEGRSFHPVSVRMTAASCTQSVT
jgi:hypothetical protein